MSIIIAEVSSNYIEDDVQVMHVDQTEFFDFVDNKCQLTADGDWTYTLPDDDVVWTIRRKGVVHGHDHLPEDLQMIKEDADKHDQFLHHQYI